MNINEKIDDLIIQATKERSHYYVRSVLVEVKSELANAYRERDHLKITLEASQLLLSTHISMVDNLEAEIEELREILLGYSGTYGPSPRHLKYGKEKGIIK